jgi:uncharacterized protein (TIGR00369 family)
LDETQSNPLIEMVRQCVGGEIPNNPSAVGRWLRPKLLRVHEDGLEASVLVRPEMTNPANVLHGGMIAAMMDEMLGATTFIFSGGRYYASINLSVDYLASAHAGDEVIVRSRLLRRGKRLVHGESTLCSASGELLARASTNLITVGNSDVDA